MDASSLVSTPALNVTVRTEAELESRRLPQNVRWTPLTPKSEVAEAIFWLDGVCVGLFKRSASLIEGMFQGDYTVLTINLDDQEDAHSEEIVINGQATRFKKLTIGRGGAWYKVVQSVPWKCFQVMFPSRMLDRGWPDSGMRVAAVPVTVEALASVRRALTDMFRLASLAPERFDIPNTVEGMIESLYGVFDQAFLAAAPIRECGISASHYRIARQIDEYIAANFHRPIYNDELSAALNITSRTMHNVVRKFNGMSLHQYLRLRRLWAVRRALLMAEPATLVKSVALEHGFWHLGRFSVDYRRHFGETPTQSLDRARAN